jgi:thymidylate synthase
LDYKINLKDGFPLLTTKKMPFKTILTELLWFLQGHTNVKWLIDRGCRIWDEWSSDVKWAEIKKDKGFYADMETGRSVDYLEMEDVENYLKTQGYTKVSVTKWCKGAGEVDAGYGRWWRAFPYIGEVSDPESNQIWLPCQFDQIDRVIQELKTNPMSRRMVVTAWSPYDAWNAKLPPCHDMFVVNVTPGTPHTLNFHLTQRSCDVGLGLPFNTASYAILMHILANEAGMRVGYFHHTLVDAHIYNNHIDKLKEQIKRIRNAPPTLTVNPETPWRNLDQNDFSLEGYISGSKIDLEVAV